MFEAVGAFGQVQRLRCSGAMWECNTHSITKGVTTDIMSVHSIMEVVTTDMSAHSIT
jgi:hypothetical protein